MDDDEQQQIQSIFDDRQNNGISINFERNRIIKNINHSKRISATEKIMMMLVLVGLAFTIFSAATMYFQNCWVVSSIPFYFGSLQFSVTFGISKIELWTYKMIGIMNILTAIINLIMYYVQFLQNILCSNAICHSNFTGAYIIDNIPSDDSHCSNFDDMNSLQKTQQALKTICSTPVTENNSNAIASVNAAQIINDADIDYVSCNPQLKELYVFNQTGYFIGLMIVTSMFLLHGAIQLYKAIRIDRLKVDKGKQEDFSLQIQPGEDINSS